MIEQFNIQKERVRIPTLEGGGVCQYEYKMAVGINEIQANNGLPVNNGLAVICVLLAIFGIGIASLAIQQWEINKFYNAREDI